MLCGSGRCDGGQHRDAITGMGSGGMGLTAERPDLTAESSFLDPADEVRLRPRKEVMHSWIPRYGFPVYGAATTIGGSRIGTGRSIAWRAATIKPSRRRCGRCPP